ncbi:transducin beta-like protein 2 [Mizuhopecten yessoensis]|uniref:Transducin beta-like protein 2 n=1 Tax=Mizuhopecten yessoensis TaxID=6573 RepID=A0A210QWI7_MIZYE|nr:transducin beta-like protein 2 [Mizuhopecten yessoensis]OWF53107.1 Transducin beta-like protein 2 [Mizuhopecten yessoensis]
MADISEASSVPALAVTAAVGAVVLLLVLLCSVWKKETKEQKQDSDENQVTKTKADPVKQEKNSKKSKLNVRTKKPQQLQVNHPWLASTLKGNSSAVLGIDFSPNGKYLITTAEDRCVMLWGTKDFNQREHKFIKGIVELDHGTQVKFSPDTKAFIVSLANDNALRVYRIGKKDDGSPGNITSAFDFPKTHQSDIISIGIATNGRFIMSCGSDTTILIWTIKGEVLDTIDTHQMNNSFACVSPCGRFVASSGFTPDVKVWEVCFDKNGSYVDTKRAFELKGHSAGVYSFSFNNDSSRMASVSKDGTWKYWDTNVRYEMNQDPYLLHTGNISYSGYCLIALSPDGRTVAVGGENSITFFNAISSKEEETVDNIHIGGLVDLSFDTTNKYLVTAGDRYVHVFHNVTGYRATIEDLLEKEKKAPSTAVRERVRQQILDAKSSLASILGQSNGHASSK